MDKRNFLFSSFGILLILITVFILKGYHESLSTEKISGFPIRLTAMPGADGSQTYWNLALRKPNGIVESFKIAKPVGSYCGNKNNGFFESSDFLTQVQSYVDESKNITFVAEGKVDQKDYLRTIVRYQPIDCK